MNEISIKQILFGILFVAILVGGYIIYDLNFFEPIIIEIYLDTKKDECIKAGGEYGVRDFSWEDDGSDYRATCTQPEKELWEISLN